MKNLYKKFGSYSQYEEIKYTLHKCVYDSLIKYEFEECWYDMLSVYDLHENVWLRLLHSD